MQLLRNVFQVGGSLNGVTVCGDYNEGGNFFDGNSYAINTPEGILLFDCGNGDTLDQIFANLRYWSLDPEKIVACFITHPHWDHAGACHKLKRLGVKLYAHVNTAHAIAAGDRRCCGFLYHKKFIPTEVDFPLQEGDTVQFGALLITAHHFPGHTQGCTAFCFDWEGKSVVVSGDIIGTLMVGYFGWSGSIDFDRKVYLESLKRFSEYTPDVMLPGHGLIYLGNPQSRIETALNQALIQWR